MAAPNKQERQKCWMARDEFWKCLEENGEDVNKCTSLRAVFEASCSSQWLKYFDRRRNFMKFQEKMEKEGYDPITNTNESSS